MTRQIDNREDVRRFLEANQPMVSDLDFNAETYERYSEVLQVLIKDPDLACVELFLNSLTTESHEGIAQSFADVLRALDRKTVVAQLERLLVSGNPGGKAWAAEYAVEFADPALITPLAGILRDAASSRDAVIFAVSALETIRGETGAPEADLALRTLYHENETWRPLQNAAARSEAAMRTTAMNQAIIASETAFRNKDYPRVVSLLNPYTDTLPDVPRRRLRLAQKLLSAASLDTKA
ncbi:MAG: hypothetical protein ACO1SX_01755 [Actinomycetota bacterium]